ncbi:FGGY-family carbohydrate kinase [Klebsiella variicola]|nr:FGGY-family carbohydrate kinase [Klebsiella variicola]
MRQHEEFTLTALMVDGGPTNNDWLMQYQADLLGCPVMRSDVPSCPPSARRCWPAKRSIRGRPPICRPS